MKLFSKYILNLQTIRLYSDLYIINLVLLPVIAVIAFAFFLIFPLIIVLSVEGNLIIAAAIGIIVIVFGLHLIINSVLGKAATKRFLKEAALIKEHDINDPKFINKYRKMYQKSKNNFLGTTVGVLYSSILINSDKAEEALPILRTHYEKLKSAEVRDEISLCSVCNVLFAALMRTGETEEAGKMYYEKTGLCEKNVEANRIFGGSLKTQKVNLDIDNGIFDDAEDYLKEELEKENHFAAKYLLGKLYMLQGRKDEATPLLRESAQESEKRDRYIYRKANEYLNS